MTTMRVHESEAPAAVGGTELANLRTARRGLYLRDSLVVVVLCLVTVTLFGITLFLFRSFEGHRADLGRRWSARGRVALAQGHPDAAAAALRTALSYAPEDSADQLLLAQALAAAGHVEAANNYFLSLWEVRPGDGPINLQLARLARTRGNAGEAIDYYRASIFGNWEGDGVLRRREIRLELADYLLKRGQTQAAQAELLIAAGNAPERDIALQLEIADRLQALGDLPDALHYYRIAAAQAPRNAEALASEGHVEYLLEDYAVAARSLATAAELMRRSRGKEATIASLNAEAAAARRLPELSVSRDLPVAERAAHLALDAGIAERRLRSCTAQPVTMTAPATAPATASATAPAALATLSALRSRWTAEGRAARRGALERDADLQDDTAQLIADTETQLAPLCGAPSGDDALLLLMARKQPQPGQGASQ